MQQQQRTSSLLAKNIQQWLVQVFTISKVLLAYLKAFWLGHYIGTCIILFILVDVSVYKTASVVTKQKLNKRGAAERSSWKQNY